MATWEASISISTALLLGIGALAAGIAPSSAADPDAPSPEQVHLTLTTDGRLVVQWITLAPYPDASAPHVAWTLDGTEQPPVTALTSGATTARTLLHAATLPMVPPSSSISYQVGVPGQMSAPFTTRTLPAADTPLRLVAYGDVGYAGLQEDGTSWNPADPDASKPIKVRDLALAQNPDLVVLPGDLSYADDNKTLPVDRTWSAWMRMMEPLAATRPTIPATGNHDNAQWYNGYSDYLARYVLPNDEHYFGFHAGPAYVVVADSEQVCINNFVNQLPVDADPSADPCFPRVYDPQASAQLEVELRNAAASGSEWILVAIHRTPYPGYHEDNYAAALRHYWTPLFERYGVDVVLAAHDHLYARSFPMIQDVPTTREPTSYVEGEGPIYTILGGGGRSLYRFETPRTDWVAASADRATGAWHVAVLDITADSLRFEAVKHDQTHLDGFTLTKRT